MGAGESPSQGGSSEGLTFEPLSERPNFPQLEEETLRVWREEKTFEKSLKLSKDKPPFSFYDGPPFATGLPHYGHILAGTIKDVVCRFAHQTGHYVERRFGWDCHGLPIEFEIDKMLKINKKQQVLEFGIPQYNQQCRSIVLRYSAEWEKIVERTGRWIDFKNGYRTMDRDYMESVWWVFKELFKKGRIYRAFKVMPFSTACGTPLSNFEANQNYKDVRDPSLIVAFKCTDTTALEGPFEFAAWTTTPWTLPSNLALCVHPTMTYIKALFKPQKRTLVVAKERLEWICKQMKLDPATDVEILSEFPGEKLRNLPYSPPFDCFPKSSYPSAFRVCVDSFVTSDSGTGVVHCAPAFGEDDYRVCIEQKVIEVGGPVACGLDESGCFVPAVGFVEGLDFKVGEKKIKGLLQSEGLLLCCSELLHAYPFCWRSDTPLIYRAVPSWFVRVADLRQQLLQRSSSSRWVPAALQQKRFHNWLAEAKDWCISRNRFWGTPLPIWTNEDYSQIVCIGSVAELEKYAGRKLPDIHRDQIDDIEIPDPRGDQFPKLKRVEEVFDCWFESGSMPYAQQHYPFENQKHFEETFPANCVAEGLDQTRGWFYTLMVLSTSLFDKPAFQNLIANGLVLAADGRKMSKRLQNYPSLSLILEEVGGDALRLYLLRSPVVKGETLNFKQEGVKDVVKDVLLPWYHATRFFIQEVIRYETTTGKRFQPAGENEENQKTNIMDKWILSETHRVIQFVREEIEAYRLYTIVPQLLSFLELLTNWYLRLNRDRMRGAQGPEVALEALQTLFSVLLTTVIYMAPLTPFLSEYLYQALKKGLSPQNPLHAESVHFLMLPAPNPNLRNAEIDQRMERMRSVILMGRTLRERRKVSLKRPVLHLRCLVSSQEHVLDLLAMESYIKEELNVCEMEAAVDTLETPLAISLNFKLLGPRVGPHMQQLHAAAKALTQQQLREFEKEQKILLNGILLTPHAATLQRQLPQSTNPNLGFNCDKNCVIAMDFTEDPSLQRKAIAREIANRVQKLRKQLQLQQQDEVLVFAAADDAALKDILIQEKEYIESCLRRPLLLQEANKKIEAANILYEETYTVAAAPLTLTIVKN